MTRMPLAASVALVLLAAGCISSTSPQQLSTPAPSDVPVDFVNPIELEHDHGLLEDHDVVNQMELVGRTGIGADGYPPGGIGEIDVAGDYAYVAMLGFGFAVVDLRDPSHPETVAVVEAASPDPIKYVADLKVDATGDWVFLAMELSSTPGVLIYDVRDRADPKLAGIWVEPGLLAGCHMIEYAIIGGDEYLFCAPLDNAVYVGLISPVTPAGVRTVAQVARFTPHTAKFVEENIAAGTAVALRQVSGHQDMTYVEDPLTGTPMLYVSFWNLGVRFVDVSIPALPLEVGSWDGGGSDQYTGNIHTTVPFESQGRRIVVTIPEVADPPALFVLDATDFNNPVLLGEWMALPDFGPQAGTFSLHNFQIIDQKVYLAMYHGGVWVLDMSSDQRLTAPAPVGSYIPHEPREDGADYRPSVWDVVVWNGYVLTGDSNTGLYVLHHTPDPAGDPEYTSFA